MRTIRITSVLVLVALLGIGVGRAQTVDAPAQLKGVTVERQAEGVTVTVQTTGPIVYQAKVIDSPTRLVIDMDGTVYASPKARWTANLDPVKEVRGSQWKRGTARIVVELTRKVGYRIEDTAEGLVVILEPSTSGQAPAAARVEMAKKPDVVSDAPKAAVIEEPKPEPVAAVAAATPAPAPTAAPAEKPAAAPRPVTDPLGSPAAAPRPVTDPLGSPAAAPRPVTDPLGSPAAAPRPATRVAQAQPAPAPAPAPTPAQPAGPSGEKLISLDFKDADIVNLLRILAAESGKNIVAGDDVKGKVSVSLRNVTWQQALDTILETRGLQKVEKEGVIRVVTIEQLTKEREAVARVEEAKRKAEIDSRTKMAEAQIKEQELAIKKLQSAAAASEAESRGPLREELIRLSYADPVEVAKTLQGILGIPPEGTAPVAQNVIPSTLSSTGLGGPGPIAEPPFSQLYGPQAQQAQPGSVRSVSQDVLAKGITIQAYKPTNSIFIRHYQADLERLKKLIREQLDVPQPQVKIEARMEILDRTALEAIGVQWGGGGVDNFGPTTLVGQGYQTVANTLLGNIPVAGGVLQPDGTTITLNPTTPSNIIPRNPNLALNRLLPVQSTTGLPIGGNLINLPFQALPNTAGQVPAGGIAFGIIGTRYNINLALQALASQGKTRTLARPEIVTVENNKAEVSLGEEIPYATVSSAGTQIQFKEALLKLTVTPTVIREKIDDQILVKIKMVVIVENNSRGTPVDLGTTGNPPAINRRKAETQVLINEGERLVIGGVTTASNQTTVRKVPLFGDIPILGWLFKQKGTFEEGRELVIFLTPTVLKAIISQAAPPAPAR
jgi:type IV pilus secretin PilQ/predicted competence protein